MLPFWAVSLDMLPRIDGKESIHSAQRAYMQEAARNHPMTGSPSCSHCRATGSVGLIYIRPCVSTDLSKSHSFGCKATIGCQMELVISVEHSDACIYKATGTCKWARQPWKPNGLSSSKQKRQAHWSISLADNLPGRAILSSCHLAQLTQ